MRVLRTNGYIEDEMQSRELICNIYTSEEEAKKAVEMYTEYEEKSHYHKAKSEYYYGECTVLEKCPATIEELELQRHDFEGEDEEEDE